ncbi:protein-cysteine N-palmitoyltransferase HHAT-like isoform X1 [Ornithodoros turicata]|uniref:protein-cysteine N-palmitoyltransferase HHAT-like isoform X1 n=1 Tax=Ornithodoros turicata TaxID=34597 RepID=UPI003138D67E
MILREPKSGTIGVFILKAWHWIIWITATTYALWRFTTHRLTQSLPELDPFSFSQGMFGIHRHRDITDHEWNVTMEAYHRFYPVLFLQPLLTQLLFRYNKQLVPYFYAAYSTVFLLWNYGWPTTLLFYTVHASMFLATFSRREYVCFILLVVIILQSQADLLPSWFKDQYRQHGAMVETMTESGLSWVGTRSLSFAVDFIRESHNEEDTPDYWKTLGYVLYLPSIMTGPLINYSDFQKQMLEGRPTWTWRRLLGHVVDILKCLIFHVAYTLTTHWFYSSAMSVYPNVVQYLDAWSKAGLAFGLVMMFYLKYRVLYGIPVTIASMEDIRLPTYPKCVGRIHLCSYVWRHFDRGLHLWLVRYVYVPLIGGHRTAGRRALAAAACFSLVWLWHDLNWALFVWCSLNFFGLMLESSVSVLRTKPFLKNLVHWSAWHEVWAVFAAPHYLLSLTSSMFFLASPEVALLLLDTLIMRFPLPVMPLLLVLYCGCHVSMDVMTWESATTEK